MKLTQLLQTGTEATLFLGPQAYITFGGITIFILILYFTTRLPVRKFHQLEAGMPIIIVKAKPGKHPVVQTLANYEEIKEKPYTGNRKLFKIHKREVATYCNIKPGRKYEVLERNGEKILEDTQVTVPLVTQKKKQLQYTD